MAGYKPRQVGKRAQGQGGGLWVSLDGVQLKLCSTDNHLKRIVP